MHRIMVEAGPKKRKLGGELSVRVKYSREKTEMRRISTQGAHYNANVQGSFVGLNFYFGFDLWKEEFYCAN